MRRKPGGIARTVRGAVIALTAVMIPLTALLLAACTARRPAPASVQAPAVAAQLLPCRDADCLRVLTWNLHGIPLLSPSPPARLRNVAAKIREQQPDVVLLQEIWSHAYSGQLARDLPGYRASFATGCWRPFPCGGLVVLVRRASGWVAAAPTFVPYEASAPWYRFREWDGIVKKGMLLLTLARGAATLGLADTHLQTEYAWLGRDYTEIRARQLEQLDLVLRSTFGEQPVVIGGDFNTAPEERSGLYGSHVVRVGEDRTVDERDGCACGTRPPGSFRVSSRWLDYVLTRHFPANADAERITNDWVDRPFSDHDGVLVRLEPDEP